ncbi:MAG TPA: hypothetical protein VIN61_14280 [Gammaproteobacteria bacterium]
MHLAALGGVAWLDAPLAVRAAGAALLVLHAVVRRPRRPPVLCRHTDGRWSVAGQTPGGLRLDPATVFGRRWARLVFRVEGAHRRARLAVLLLRDQVPAEAWRALQAELRRSSAARPERPPDFS